MSDPFLEEENRGPTTVGGLAVLRTYQVNIV